MGWGFGTWDANGVDNNTGLVKINALATIRADASTTGSFSYAVPSGYSLSFLVQAGGPFSAGRRKITISGGVVTLANTTDTDYSAGTYPRYATSFILIYAR